MFTAFFYLLRARGLKVSMGEWMTLIKALHMGLAAEGLTAFYYLARGILVTSESDFDKFDLAFMEFFGDIEAVVSLPEEFFKWLENPHTLGNEQREHMERFFRELEELRRMFEERMREQTERHDGGSHWIGTGGTSPFGHGGFQESGIRVGGEGRHSRALQIAGEQRFRDFRQDVQLEARQFQMAFRKLRQYSARMDLPQTELDIDKTVSETSDHAGMLRIVYAKPRSNTVKLMVLFDSGGSMSPYHQLTGRLFSAVSKSNHFKDLQFYYFHNCVYEKLYTTPYIRRGDWVDTDFVLSGIDASHKLIFVGDAAMAPPELERTGGNSYWGMWNEEPGIEWLKKIKKRAEKSIWLNPLCEVEWQQAYGRYTINKIADIFPMFEMTLDGLERGIRRLLVSR